METKNSDTQSLIQKVLSGKKLIAHQTSGVSAFWDAGEITASRASTVIFTFNAGGIKTIPWYIAGKARRRSIKQADYMGTHNEMINKVVTKKRLLGGEGEFQFFFPASNGNKLEKWMGVKERFRL